MLAASAAGPELATALRSGDQSSLSAFTSAAAAQPGIEAVAVLDNAGRQMAAAGVAQRRGLRAGWSDRRGAPRR